MKVVHLLACPLASGAGRAVANLHSKFLARGLDSSVIGRIEAGLPPELNTARLPFHDRVRTNVSSRLSTRVDSLRFKSAPDFGFIQRGSNFGAIAAYRDADIVHVQWANALSMGRLFWRALARERRPVFWTLRDMWPFTGGCHFGAGCSKFETGCGGCPQLSRPFETTTARQAVYKRAHLPDNITFLAISEHFALEARRSSVLADREVCVIPNSVGIERFARSHDRDPREALELTNNKLVLTSGAINISSPRKGALVLARLISRYSRRDDVAFAFFGSGFEDLQVSGRHNCKSFGLIFDDEVLGQIYSASDLFLMPSLQESFGKVTIEAMASATPVIAYRGTPAEEMILDGENGWLVPHGDGDAFIAAVDHAVGVGRQKLAEMGRRAQVHALAHFSLDSVADRHIAIYQEKLQG